MKRAGIIISVFILVLSLVGCGTAAIDTNNRIVAPQNNLTPMQGKWIVESCLTKDASNTIEKTDDWVGKTAMFSADTIAMGDIVTDNIRYKIKRVNAEEYLLHKFKGPIDKLGINDYEAQVITVSSEDKYLVEFIKVSEDMVIANIDNEFFCLRKTSEEVEEIIGGETISRSGIVRDEEDKQPLRSGVLLGIRTPEKSERNSEKNTTFGYKYRTLWIANDNDVIRPVIEAEDLFLPRKNGFWKLMVREKLQEQNKEDELIAYSLNKVTSDNKEEVKADNDFWSIRNGVIRKAIQYAGNDYVVIENIGTGTFKHSTKSWQQNRLQVLPVDSLSNTDGVRITDIAVENGSMAMDRAISSLLETYDASYLKDAIKETQDVSFGLYRKTGHWFFKGRIGFEQKEQVPFVDFNINLIPQADFVAYDILQVPWTHIKDRVPNAIDAFTSPNADIALILTKEQILIYKITEEMLSEAPLKKIALEKGDAVVMAEWASGYYVNRWESIFIKNNKTKEIGK